MFIEDPVIGGLTYHDKGVVKVPEAVGLGAQIPEDYLDKFEKVVL